MNRNEYILPAAAGQLKSFRVNTLSLPVDYDWRKFENDTLSLVKLEVDGLKKYNPESTFVMLPPEKILECFDWYINRFRLFVNAMSTNELDYESAKVEWFSKMKAMRTKSLDKKERSQWRQFYPVLSVVKASAGAMYCDISVIDSNRTRSLTYVVVCGLEVKYSVMGFRIHLSDQQMNVDRKLLPVSHIIIADSKKRGKKRYAGVYRIPLSYVSRAAVQVGRELPHWQLPSRK